MQTHVRVLAILHILIDGVYLLIGLWLFSAMGMGGSHTMFSVILFLLFVVLAVPGLVVGLGLLALARWARILGIVVSVLDLFLHPPIMTAVGVYGLVVLLHQDTVALFEGPRPQSV